MEYPLDWKSLETKVDVLEQFTSKTLARLIREQNKFSLSMLKSNKSYEINTMHPWTTSTELNLGLFWILSCHC